MADCGFKFEDGRVCPYCFCSFYLFKVCLFIYLFIYLFHSIYIYLFIYLLTYYFFIYLIFVYWQFCSLTPGVVYYDC